MRTGKFGKDDGKGKSWYKGKDDGKGKSWNPFGKTGKDDKGKGKFGKGKYKQGKCTKGGNKSGDVNMKGSNNYHKAPANSQFQSERSHCSKWGHKASECWRKQVAGVGEDGTGTDIGASASAVGSASAA